MPIDSPEPHSATPIGHPFAAMFDVVREDFAALNALIPRLLTSDVSLVEEIGRYVVESGGKRLRPLIVLLSARSCGYSGDQHVDLAAIIELLHTATLLHDDVIDQSALRRGRATANASWGNAPTVLVGDFLYSRAFQLMASLERMDIIHALADATNIIAAGEVQQLAEVGNAALTEQQYMDVIRGKTAVLFEAAAHTSALLAQVPPTQVAAMRSYGLNLGMAYQLIDDVLDYEGSTAALGKNVGDDLAEGKLTLPLIRTLSHGSAADARLIRDAVSTHARERLDEVICAVQRSGALAYTRAQAEQHADTAIRALAVLPAHVARDNLTSIAQFAVSRTS